MYFQNRISRFLFSATLFVFAAFAVQAQPGGQVVDRIVAVVGGQMVKYSELQNNLMQLKNSGAPTNENSLTEVLEELMLQKLLVSQAYRDSLKVGDGEVDQEIDRRMRYYLQQFGTTEAFEQFYGKSVEAFKLELREKIRELLLAQRMQAKVIGDITVSPSEVKAYFNGIPKDSLPFINAEIEVGHIVAKPKVNTELKEYTKKNLEDLRGRIMRNEIDFCAACRSYSEDPGSIDNCCTYKNVRRGMFVPEFEAVAFRLKEGEISEIVETEYGYHIIKLIARKGDEIDVAHILRVPPITAEDLRVSKTRLDSILHLIEIDTVDFCEAAAKYSDEEDSRYNCGLILNPQTGTSRIETSMLGQIDPTQGFPLFLDEMKTGAISKPVLMTTRDGRQAYRLVWLKSRIEPHIANLIQDYQRMQDDAQIDKQRKTLDTWVNRKLETTYVHIADDFKNSKFEHGWLKYAK
ncbi:MAG: parvulin-like peptidyl-prolyl isomerase [Bacteroidetes bacterium]|nr:MAG: parvulin-like peptidyl-prolyl isomerase [Bacteroidota bacterium]